jgi:hypothetical protein
MMIARSEINLGEILGTSELIKQIINPWQGVLVLDGDQCTFSLSHPSS